MHAFTFQSQPARVVFGEGALAQLSDEIDHLNLGKVLVLSTPQQEQAAHDLASQIGARAAGVFAGAIMHVPVESVHAAVAEAQRLGADGLLAVGGGSTTGLAKGVALQIALPIVAVPTTYAGSEVTSIFGLTEGGLKKTGRDPRVLPRTVIYDPTLTLTLPVSVSIASGMNAIAHAAEGLYARDGNPVTAMMAEEGIRALACAFPRICINSQDAGARSDALYGAWLCGTVLGSVGMSLHHKLCHTLGGSFNLPHAEVHTVVLPQALAFNAPAAPQAMDGIARALGVLGRESAPAAIFDLARDNGAPTALRDIGMRAADLDRAADIAVQNPYWNPRPIGAAERGAIRELLQAAYEGRRPD